MGSIAQRTKRSKKTRRLGPVQVLRPDQYAVYDVNTKVECIQTLIPLGLMHVQALLEAEVCRFAGQRYARKSPELPGRRHGSNPGSVRLAGQQVSLRIPRVRQIEREEEIPLATHSALRGSGELDDVLLKRVLYGISCRNYEAAAAAVPGGDRVIAHILKRSAPRYPSSTGGGVWGNATRILSTKNAHSSSGGEKSIGVSERSVVGYNGVIPVLVENCDEICGAIATIIREERN